MKKALRLFFITFMVMSFVLLAADFRVKSMNTAAGKPLYVPDRIIVKFALSISRVDAEGIAQAFGLQKLRESLKPGVFVVYQHPQPDMILVMLNAHSGVVYAEQEAYRYACKIPNDPYFSYQWHMTRIDADNAWDVANGSGVVVAVIDTGVLQTLEDLNTTSFVPGYDFVNGDNDPTDDNGHGSHVAGTVAQSTDNNRGVAGVAYKSSIMPVKVLDAVGSGWDTDIADGIYYAADHGADIINLSLGGYGLSTSMEDAVNYAWSHGVVVVCAAGNDNTSGPFYPAAYTNSISVSATEWLDMEAYYSNWGTTIDICAPGGDVTVDRNGDGYVDGVLQNTFDYSYYPPEGYYFWQGTSMASPHVAGVAALVKSLKPTLTNTEIRNILESTAVDLGTSGKDIYYGYGQVNAYNAVMAVAPYVEYGYVVAGFGESFTYGGRDFLVYKLDKDGNKEWRKNYGGTNDDGAYSIRQTSHGGYIVGGYSSSFTYGNNDFLVYKLDAVGNKEWRKNYGGVNSDYLSTAIQTTDGGYILYGDTQSFTYGWLDLLVYKLDTSGNKVWRKNYGGTDDDMAFADRWPTGTAICQTTDGGYAFIGTSYSFSHGLSDFITYKLKADGSKEWRKNYGGTGDDQGYSIQQTTDGGYILAGFSDSSFSYGNDDFLLYKLDASGNKQWRKNFGGTNLDQGLSVIQTSDGGYVVAGFSDSFAYGGFDFLLYKLDASGNKEWRKNYGGTNYERGTSIVQTSDGGYVVAGFSDSFTYGGYDFLLYKLDASGNKVWRKNYGGTQADQAFCVRETID